MGWIGLGCLNERDCIRKKSFILKEGKTFSIEISSSGLSFVHFNVHFVYFFYDKTVLLYSANNDNIGSYKWNYTKELT